MIVKYVKKHIKFELVLMLILLSYKMRIVCDWVNNRWKYEYYKAFFQF